jgi:hypothetical protein
MTVFEKRKVSLTFKEMKDALTMERAHVKLRDALIYELTKFITEKGIALPAHVLPALEALYPGSNLEEAVELINAEEERANGEPAAEVNEVEGEVERPAD